MDRDSVKEVLSGTIREDDSLRGEGHYVDWQVGSHMVTLDSDFTADELEAIAWWMQHHTGKPA